ncbi:hypothetical protein [Streptomyces triticirhizae]|uniref:hypothetical protein n=1 Tax=Streptomyces triticirhizae TaxID=2483353 RepID=UPI00131596A2|nr:hypothetical protein [Streptomyces triticirhizae]
MAETRGESGRRGRRETGGRGGAGERGHWSQRRLPALTAMCAGLAIWLAQVVEAATR